MRSKAWALFGPAVAFLAVLFATYVGKPLAQPAKAKGRGSEESVAQKNLRGTTLARSLRSGRGRESGTTSTQGMRSAQPRANQRTTKSGKLGATPSKMPQEQRQRAASRESAKKEQLGPKAIQKADQVLFADPYGLLRTFSRRWDFIRVLPTSTEMQEYYRRATEDLIRFLQRALDQTTLAHRRAEHNFATAVRFLYVLDRAHQQPCYWPAPYAAAYRAALRKTIRRDSHLLGKLISTHAILREELNATAERRMLLYSETAAMSNVEKFLSPSITVTETDWIRAWNQWLVSLRVPGPEAVAAVSDLEWIEGELAQRVALNSLLPLPPAPLPAYLPYVPADVPVPIEALPPPRKRFDDEKVDVPQSLGWRVAAPPGAEVHAVAAGTVQFVGSLRGLGGVVILEHGRNVYGIYGELGETRVKVGESISQGSVIGRTRSDRDSTLYFEVREGEVSVPVERLLGQRKPEELLLQAR